MEGFVLFEAIRNEIGGGSIIGVHEILQPLLISAYKDEFELLVVETKIGNQEIRFMTGYGPQECWDEANELPFFVELNLEIVKAKKAGKSIFINGCKQ